MSAARFIPSIDFCHVAGAADELRERVRQVLVVERGELRRLVDRVLIAAPCFLYEMFDFASASSSRACAACDSFAASTVPLSPTTRRPMPAAPAPSAAALREPAEMTAEFAGVLGRALERAFGARRVTDDAEV
jgi:hypothetical protein